MLNVTRQIIMTNIKYPVLVFIDFDSLFHGIRCHDSLLSACFPTGNRQYPPGGLVLFGPGPC